jgi:hypothetical protein
VEASNRCSHSLGEHEHSALLRAEGKARESPKAEAGQQPPWQLFFEHLEAQIVKATEFLASRLNANLERDLSAVSEKRGKWK